MKFPSVVILRAKERGQLLKDTIKVKELRTSPLHELALEFKSLEYEVINFGGSNFGGDEHDKHEIALLAFNRSLLSTVRNPKTM